MAVYMTCVCLTLNINFWYKEMVHEIFCVMEGSRNMCYLAQLRISCKYSSIHFQQYQPTLIAISIGIECH